MRSIKQIKKNIIWRKKKNENKNIDENEKKN